MPNPSAAFAISPFIYRPSSLCSSSPSSFTHPLTPHRTLIFAKPLPSPRYVIACIPSPPHATEDPPLRFYNTLTRSKQPFTTVEPGIVRFYSCGPTVYDYAHIGNFRAFLTYDLIKRWLLYRDYTVNHVMNITDVDDKIIRKAAELKCAANQLTQKFSLAFFQDLHLLNIIPAQHYPRATGHIPDIEHVVSDLKSRGYAYERDNSVYFSVSAFESYGRLAQLEKSHPISSASASSASASSSVSDTAARTDADEYDKNDLRDFALWKSFKPEDGDVFWDTSLGKGRPGWHIECSCMAMKYLGPQVDIHAGGIDLVFPHHENEIAQSEALTGLPFARFWLHNGFVNIDDQKMSKSLANFRTLRDIVTKPEHARAFRYLVVSSQYRSALAFTAECMTAAINTIKRLDALRSKLESVDDDATNSDMTPVIDQATSDFCHAMDDDLNTPRAAAAMFLVVNAAEKRLKAGTLGFQDAEDVLDCLDDMDRVFGIFYTPVLDNGATSIEESVSEHQGVPEELVDLLSERAEARKAKNYGRADEIRQTITAAGFSILDTPQGAKLQRIES